MSVIIVSQNNNLQEILVYRIFYLKFLNSLVGTMININIPKNGEKWFFFILFRQYIHLFPGLKDTDTSKDLKANERG